MFRCTTTEDIDLAFTLDHFAVATNWLYRRSDLHNTLLKAPKRPANPAAPFDKSSKKWKLTMDLLAHLRPNRHPLGAYVLHKEARILHISRSITSPAPLEEVSSLYNSGHFTGNSFKSPITRRKKAKLQSHLQVAPITNPRTDPMGQARILVRSPIVRAIRPRELLGPEGI